MAQDEVLNIAKQYADAVRKTMDTSAVYLYGSYARGTASKDSDIDIAVIVDVIPADYLQTVAGLWSLTRKYSDAIEPVLLSPADSQSGFLQTVRNTGIAV